MAEGEEDLEPGLARPTIDDSWGAWEPQWCVIHGRWYYMNKVLGLSSWSRPSPTVEDLPETAPQNVEASPGGCLPEGWEVAYDVQYKRYYYFHRAIGVRQWGTPTAMNVPVVGEGVSFSPRTTSPSNSSPAGPHVVLPLEVKRRAAGSLMIRGQERKGTNGSSPSCRRRTEKKLTTRNLKQMFQGPIDTWDAEDSARKLLQARAVNDKKARRKLMREVAEDNYMRMMDWPEGETVLQPHIDLVEWFERTAAPSAPKRVPKVTFSCGSVTDAILHFGSLHPGKVAALNSADGLQVGGNYKSGANGVEEDLCRRCPNLYSSLYQAKRDGFYPFGPGASKGKGSPTRFAETLWSVGVIAARGSEAQGFEILPSEQHSKVGIVSAAAPEPGKKNADGTLEVWDEDLVYMTIKSIFLVPAMLQPSTRVFILGAFGCRGCCDPNAMASLFARALAGKDFLGRFYSEVHFAIPPEDGDARNTVAFRSTFERMRIPSSEVRL